MYCPVNTVNVLVGPVVFGLKVLVDIRGGARVSNGGRNVSRDFLLMMPYSSVSFWLIRREAWLCTLLH